MPLSEILAFRIWNFKAFSEIGRHNLTKVMQDNFLGLEGHEIVLVNCTLDPKNVGPVEVERFNFNRSYIFRIKGTIDCHHSPLKYLEKYIFKFQFHIKTVCLLAYKTSYIFTTNISQYLHLVMSVISDERTMRW